MVVVSAGPAGAHKVLLISGKQGSGPLGRSVSVLLPPAAHPGSDSDCSSTAPPLRKRQRLTHLSPEEKALRRKLKNRVAAQTARDRKKAKMGELEQQVLELEQENQKLHMENEVLRERASDLLSENQELRQRLGLDTLETNVKVQAVESRASDLVLVTGSSESAVLRLRVPPQQVQAQPSSNLKISPWILTLLTIQTLSLISCSAFWTSLTQICSSRLVSRKQQQQQIWSSSSSWFWLDQPESRYLPPHLELWGPHQLSWRPLMN